MHQKSIVAALVLTLLGVSTSQAEEAAGPFSAEFHGRLQTRVEFETPEWDSEDWEGAFLMRRARIRVKGKALLPRLKYQIQAEFGQGRAQVKVLTIDYAIKPNELHVKVGHGRRPFGRHRLTPTRLMEFVERSGIHSVFGGNRDVGIVLHNGWSVGGREGIEWSLALMNGTPVNANLQAPFLSLPDSSLFEFGPSSVNNVPDEFNPIVVARIGHNDKGMMVYSEADLEGGPTRTSFGASIMLDYGEGEQLSDGPLARLGFDMAIKSDGTSFSGVFYSQHQQGGNSQFDGSGLMVQFGHVFRGWVQPVVRYASISLRNDPTRKEYRAGLNFYFLGHGLKWQTDLGKLTAYDSETDVDEKHWEVRSQLQVAY